VAARGDVLPVGRIDATTLIDLFPRRPTRPIRRRRRAHMEHFCLVIEPATSMRSWRTFRRASCRRPVRRAGLASSVYVHDPDGNVVELRS